MTLYEFVYTLQVWWVTRIVLHLSLVCVLRNRLFFFFFPRLLIIKNECFCFSTRIKTNGSLPRESNKTGTGTSSSPTSPLSPLSPTSPSSLMTWPTTASSPSSVALSPLSPHATAGTAVNGGGDSVFLENDAIQRSSSAPPPQNANICGSPRSRIRTLVPSSSPMTAATATDLYYARYCSHLLADRSNQNIGLILLAQTRSVVIDLPVTISYSAHIYTYTQRKLP